MTREGPRGARGWGGEGVQTASACRCLIRDSDHSAAGRPGSVPAAQQARTLGLLVSSKTARPSQLERAHSSREAEKLVKATELVWLHCNTFTWLEFNRFQTQQERSNQREQQSGS